MNRFGPHAHPSSRGSVITARYAFLSVVTALMILLLIYPMTTRYRLHDNPSSTGFVQYPDITLGSYDHKPAIEGEAPTNTAAKMTSLVEQLPPQPILMKRNDNQSMVCNIYNRYYMHSLCEIHNCVTFHNMSEPWTRGCSDIIRVWEWCLRKDHSMIPEPWQHHWWELDQVKVIELLQNFISQRIHQQRAIGSEYSDESVSYAGPYCEVGHCIAFYEMFEFWYPGCENLMGTFTPYCVDVNDPKCYDGSGCDANNDDCWESYETRWYQVRGLERQFQFPKSLRKHIRREEIAAPERQRSSLNSLERRNGQDGPVEKLAVNTQVRSLEVASSLEGPHDDQPHKYLPFNSTTTTFTCPADKPNGRFCVHLGSQIIIRCHSGVGIPDNCNPSLPSAPPILSNYTPCWETSRTSGDAVCTKNCIAYPENGTANFNVPNCTPTPIEDHTHVERLSESEEIDGFVNVPHAIDSIVHEISTIVSSPVSPPVKRNITDPHAELDHIFAPQPHVPIVLKPRPKRPPPDEKAVEASSELDLPQSMQSPVPFWNRPHPKIRSPLGVKMDIEDASTELNNSEPTGQDLSPSQSKKSRRYVYSKYDESGLYADKQLSSDVVRRSGLSESEATEEGFPQSPDHFVCDVYDEKDICTYGYYEWDRQAIRRSELSETDADNEDLPQSPNHFICDVYDEKNVCTYGYYEWDGYITRRSELGEIDATNEDLPPSSKHFFCDVYNEKGICMDGDFVWHRHAISRSEGHESGFFPPAHPSPQRCREGSQDPRCRDSDSSLVERGSRGNEHNGLPVRYPEGRRPSQVIHAAFVNALKEARAIQVCEAKGTANCKQKMRILYVAVGLGIVGLGLLSIAVLDKIRRAKARRSNSLASIEPMTEKASATLDKSKEGWIGWILQKRTIENRRHVSPSPRNSAPRIPSLTLPKPTLATVRKFSGLDPDLENITEKSKGKRYWNSDSNAKWSTTM